MPTKARRGWSRVSASCSSSSSSTSKAKPLISIRLNCTTRRGRIHDNRFRLRWRHFKPQLLAIASSNQEDLHGHAEERRRESSCKSRGAGPNSRPSEEGPPSHHHYWAL